MTGPSSDDGPDRPPRSGQLLVLATLAALLTAGLLTIEAWPLTSWRLFSLSRDESQTMWVIHAVDGAGRSDEVSLEALPLRYRHAAWPMADLPEAGRERRDDVCRALLEPALGVRPELVELRIVRDRQRLVEQAGEWVVTHDPEVVHTCRPGTAP